MSDWRSINSAPKDGTVVWLRNDVMKGNQTRFTKVRGHWGEWTSPVTGNTHTVWVSDFTDLGPGDFFAAGNLVYPDEWMPIDPPEAA